MAVKENQAGLKEGGVMMMLLCIKGMCEESEGGVLKQGHKKLLLG